MPKRFLRRFMPDHGKLRSYRSLRIFGHRLHDPNLWHLNRRSVAGGLGIGVFVAFIPLPAQMLIAAALSLWLRVNLPLAVATVWITNPLTMPAIFYFTYRVGSWMLSSWPFDLLIDLSPADDWYLRNLGSYGGALLIGSLAVGVIAGLLTYGVMRLVWRLHVVSLLRRKRSRTARVQDQET